MSLFKKSLSVFLVIIVLMTSGVIVNAAGEADGDSVTTGFKREHVIKNWEKLNQSYISDYLFGFGVPMDGTNGNPDYLVPGQAVSVYIKNILPDKMKVKLVVVNRSLGHPLRFEPRYFVEGDRLDHWVYSTPQSRKVIETCFV